MKKTKDLFTVILFCLFVGSILLACIFLPDREFSELENRNLTPVPELTKNRITSGRFMTEAETYVSDQFVLRDLWVGAKAFCEHISGKKENNDVYFASDGALIRRVEEPSAAQVEKNVGYLNGFLENVDVPVYFGLIPTAATVLEEKLPTGAPSADEKAWIQTIYAASNAENIDLTAALEQHKEEYIYYRTDHHWTSLGAFYGANALLSALGQAQLKLSDYTPTQVSDSFLGTSYSAAGAWWTAPDVITAYVPEAGKEVTSNFTGREEQGALYVSKQLEVKNKYAYFLGGNQPLCVIRSQADGPKLLVIRDSYSDCLAPFLAERFSQVHLFDLRYNRLSIADYVRENGIDMVLVLYSFDQYAADNNQFLLAR